MALNHSEAKNQIIKWLKAYLAQSQTTGFVLGLSGGIDSSTTAALCRQATENVLGLILPCHSSPDAEEDARRVATQLSIPIIKHDLTSTYNHYIETLDPSAMDPTPNQVSLGNIKARLRMVTLYFHANRLKRLVVGAGNGIEIMMGYFTKFGDGGADIWPIGDLLKRDVRQIATLLKIPTDIINKPPSADLWPGQTDEGEMGITYEELDQIIGGDPIDHISPSKITKVEHQITKAKHKNVLLSDKVDNVCMLQNLAVKIKQRMNI